MFIENIHWYRLVVDEAHENFGNCYDAVKHFLLKFIQKVNCDYKWYVSGTPFYDNQGLENVMDFFKNFDQN